MGYRLILHSNSLIGRGDVVNVINMSKSLEKFIDARILVTAPFSRDFINLDAVSELRSLGLKVHIYRSQAELQAESSKFDASHCYYMKSGDYDGSHIKGLPGYVHAVFRTFEPHGEIYSYPSEWLLNSVTNNPNLLWNIRKRSRLSFLRNYNKWKRIRDSSGSQYFPNLDQPVFFLPHPVAPKSPTLLDVHATFGIPRGAKIVSRFGGLTQFSDPAGIEALKAIVKREKNIYFLLVNTKKFIEHDNVIFYNKYVSESEKSAIILASHLMLNCRLMGESFGHSICESLYFGKPILAPSLRRNKRMDANHIGLLSKFDLLYDDESDLSRKILSTIEAPPDGEALKAVVEPFSMEKFANTFYSQFLCKY